MRKHRNILEPSCTRHTLAYKPTRQSRHLLYQLTHTHSLIFHSFLSAQCPRSRTLKPFATPSQEKNPEDKGTKVCHDQMSISCLRDHTFTNRENLNFVLFYLFVCFSTNLKFFQLVNSVFESQNSSSFLFNLDLEYTPFSLDISNYYD